MLTLFKNSVNGELQEIERLIAKSEAAFVKAFREYLATLKSSAQLKAIRQYLERNDIEGLISHFNSINKPFGKVLTDTMLAAGNAEIVALKPKIERKVRQMTPPGQVPPSVGIEFQITNERAAQILRDRTTTLIREINDQQRNVIYDALADAQLTGTHTTNSLAKLIQDDIGLTRKQRQAVSNYEKLLREGNKEALNRDLRDRRFDRSVENIAEKPLTEKQIQNMVSAYRRKYEAYRGRTIARTEAGEAVSQARHEATQQAIEQAGIDASEVVQTWRSTKDKRTRDTHGSMSGQKRKFNEPFVSPSGAKLRFPRDRSLGAGASEVINCRCVTTTSIE